MRKVAAHGNCVFSLLRLCPSNSAASWRKGWMVELMSTGCKRVYKIRYSVHFNANALMMPPLWRQHMDKQDVNVASLEAWMETLTSTALHQDWNQASASPPHLPHSSTRAFWSISLILVSFFFFFNSSTFVVSKTVSVNEETGTSVLTSHHPPPGSKKKKTDKELAFALFYTGEPVK